MGALTKQLVDHLDRVSKVTPRNILGPRKNKVLMATKKISDSGLLSIKCF